MNTPALIQKSDVAAKIRMTERNLEKLVKANKFPAGLRLGKQVFWAEEVVNKWLVSALTPQLSWTPSKRKRPH